MRFTLKAVGQRFFKSPAKAYFITITASGLGVGAISFLNSSNPSLNSLSLNPPFSSDSLTFPFQALLRFSRAFFTIASNVIDYKCSLYGFPENSDEYRSHLCEIHLRSARRILELCEANKGFYVKAGQFVASLRNVPKEYSLTLASLQDQVVPCSFKAIEGVITNNLGKDLSELFLSFDEKPIAAASIAQVHHARLKDNQEVAIKVQYPGLKNLMKVDIRTMAILSKSIAWIFPEYRFDWLVSEFQKAVALELDFVEEAKNSERTARNFKKNSVLRIPQVFWELTTSQVLTMQFYGGRKVDDLEYLMKLGIHPKKVAKALMEVFAEMIFVHGFLHGDPHPGNILICPEDHEGFYFVLLDHGVYKEFNEEFRLNYCCLWKALILQDSHTIQSLGEQFGVGKYSRYLPVIFTGRSIDSNSALRRGMSAEEKRSLKQELNSIKMGDISSFMESLPPDFLTILRTDGLLRSIIRKLGAPHHVRLLAYAKYVIRGLTHNSKIESGSLLGSMIQRFRTCIDYIQLRVLLEVLEVLSLMVAFGSFFAKKIERLMSKVIYTISDNFISSKEVLHSRQLEC